MVKVIFVMTAACLLFLIAGLWIGYESHPYERCTKKSGFTDPADIGECIWLLQNQSALR